MLLFASLIERTENHCLSKLFICHRSSTFKCIYSSKELIEFSEYKRKQVEESMVENQHCHKEYCEYVLDSKELDVK